MLGIEFSRFPFVFRIFITPFPSNSLSFLSCSHTLRCIPWVSFGGRVVQPKDRKRGCFVEPKLSNYLEVDGRNLGVIRKRGTAALQLVP